MSASVIYQLKYPLTTKFKGQDGEREETRTELALRRLKGGDLRKTAHITNQELRAYELIAKLTDLQMHELDELDGEDIAALSEMIDDFLPDSLPTGTTSSET